MTKKHKKSAEDKLMEKVAAYTIDQYGPYKFLEEIWTGDPGELAEVKEWLNKAPRISYQIGMNGNGQTPEIETALTQVSRAIDDLYETIIPNIIGRPKKAF